MRRRIENRSQVIIIPGPVSNVLMTISQHGFLSVSRVCPLHAVLLYIFLLTAAAERHKYVYKYIIEVDIYVFGHGSKDPLKCP